MKKRIHFQSISIIALLTFMQPAVSSLNERKSKKPMVEPFMEGAQRRNTFQAEACGLSPAISIPVGHVQQGSADQHQLHNDDLILLDDTTLLGDTSMFDDTNMFDQINTFGSTNMFDSEQNESNTSTAELLLQAGGQKQKEQAKKPTKKPTKKRKKKPRYKPTPDQQNTYNNSLLQAAYNGNKQVVETLLEAGANKNSVDNTYGSTPLHLAAERGHMPVVELLIKYGAKTDVENKRGWIPLYAAAYNGHWAVADILRKARKDTKKNRIKLLSHHTRIIELLVNAGINKAAASENSQMSLTERRR